MAEGIQNRRSVAPDVSDIDEAWGLEDEPELLPKLPGSSVPPRRGTTPPGGIAATSSPPVGSSAGGNASASAAPRPTSKPPYRRATTLVGGMVPKPPAIPSELREEPAPPVQRTAPANRGTLIGMGVVRDVPRPRSANPTLVGVGAVRPSEPAPSARVSGAQGSQSPVSTQHLSSAPPAKMTLSGGLVAASGPTGRPPSPATPAGGIAEASSPAPALGTADRRSGAVSRVGESRVATDSTDERVVSPDSNSRAQVLEKALSVLLEDGASVLDGDAEEARKLPASKSQEDSVGRSAPDSEVTDEGPNATSVETPTPGADSCAPAIDPEVPATQPEVPAVEPEASERAADRAGSSISEMDDVASLVPPAGSLPATAMDRAGQLEARSTKSWSGFGVAAGLLLAAAAGITWWQLRPGDDAQAGAVPSPPEQALDESALAAPAIPVPVSSAAPAAPAAEAPVPVASAIASAAPMAPPSAEVEEELEPPTGAEPPVLPNEPVDGFVTVRIQTEPPGALIYERDQQIGRGGMRYLLKSGRRKTLLALRNNHEPTRFTVDGTQSSVTIVLPPSGKQAAPPAAPPSTSGSQE